MSSSTARSLLAVAALGSTGSLRAQETAHPLPTLRAEEALETARDAYYAPGEQIVSLCPEMVREEGEEGTVIVVCRTLGPPNRFQTREGPRPRMDQTADGVPRAPDVTTIPSCKGRSMGIGVCITGLGSVPPPVLMIDLTKLPEPLSAEDAARVFRAPQEEQPEQRPVTGERVPIPAD